MKWLKKWWWIALILAIALVISWEEKRCQTQAYQCRASYAARAQSERLPGNVSIYQQASEDQAIAATCEPNGYFCRLFGPANLPTMLLVIIGIGAIWAALRTLRAIEKQAEVMINSERAWVMVDLEKVPGMGGIIEGSTRIGGGPVRNSVNFCVRCVCSNQGQTAARIVEKRCEMVLVNGDDDLPDTPNLNIEIQDPIPHYLRANGDPWHGDWTIGVEGSEFPAEGKLFIIYGVVRYKHLFSEGIAQTTFGYCVSFDRTLKRLIGKSKYNENS